MNEVMDKVTEILDAQKTVKDDMEKKFNDLNERLNEVEAKATRPEKANVGKTQDEINKIVLDIMKGRPQDSGLAEDPLSSGGYLVPPEYESEIIKMAMEASPILQRLRIRDTKSNTVKIPRRLTGAVSSWVGESDSRTETAAGTYDDVTIELKGIYANLNVTNWLIEDYAGAADEAKEQIAEIMGDTLALGVLRGSGTKQIEGLLTETTNNVTGKKSVKIDKLNVVKTGVAGDFAATKPWAVFVDALASLKTKYKENCEVFVSSKTWAEMQKWVDADGKPVMMTAGVPKGADGLILGKPVYIDENVYDFDDAGHGVCAIVGEVSKAYRLYGKRGMTSIQDKYTNKGTTYFYSEKRVGGKMVNGEAVIGIVANA